MYADSILVKFIQLFHLCIVLFVAFGFLIPIPSILILHSTFAFCLLVHWYANSDVCSLSIIEAKLSGVDYTQTFMHRIVSPMYNISQYTLSKIIKVLTIFLGIASIIHLVTSKRTHLLVESIRNNGLFHDTTVKLMSIHA